MGNQKVSSNEPAERKVSLGSAIVVCFVTLIIGAGIGFYWNNVANDFLPFLGFQKTTTKNDWSELDEVYDALATNYDGKVDMDTVIEGAKKGIAASVEDIYTAYMTPDEATEFNKSLHGEVGSGIGVVIAKRDNYVRVIRTLPDNPARKAGILSGDIIYKVNGEEVYALESDAIANKMRGASGTEVTVTVVRDGEEKEFTMTRETINNVSVDITYEDKTAIIMVTRFDTDTGKIVANAAKEFSEKGINKVILDLRDNGGGYVSAARDLISLWIDSEKILIQKSIHTADDVTYAAHGQSLLKDMKTIVLVNGTTASASEIVAGALKDYKKATIIGETTYGKGVVQTLLDLSDASLLKVTTARWYTPNGDSIDKTGIKPDEEIINTYEDINAGRDPQLDAAKAK